MIDTSEIRWWLMLFVGIYAVWRAWTWGARGKAASSDQDGETQ